MFNPISRLVDLGAELMRATPLLVPIYLALLTGLHAIPVRNPHANLERLAMLQQQLAFFTTLDLYLIGSLLKKGLERKVSLYK